MKCTMLRMRMWFACTVEGRDTCVCELVCKTAGDRILDRGEEGGERGESPIVGLQICAKQRN